MSSILQRRRDSLVVTCAQLSTVPAGAAVALLAGSEGCDCCSQEKQAALEQVL